MKILYISFNVSYMDPTRELLCDILGGCGDLTLYGPGYSRQTDLDIGLDRFVDLNGPFDFIMADEFAIQDFDRLEKIGKLYFINHACAFDRTLMRLGREYARFMKAYPGRRLMALMQSDYYNFSSEKIDAIEACADYFITWGKEIVAPKESATPPDAPGVNASIFTHWTDRYRDFAISQAHRVISCPQYASTPEFHTRRLDRRPYPWSLLGANYDARVLARDILDHAGISRAGKYLPYAYVAADKLRLNPYAHYWSLNLLHWGFRHALRQSRFSFSCGSILRWPIRKYYEIPANGCVLVAEPSEGFGHLGFAHGRNVFACEARNILDAHDWLTSDPARAQSIADAGRNLVRENHSVEARSRQIGACLRRIISGDFHGSRWQNGQFVLP